MSDRNDNLSGEELSLSDLEDAAGGTSELNYKCSNTNCAVACGGSTPPPST
jgi:hypothetical protein